MASDTKNQQQPDDQAYFDMEELLNFDPDPTNTMGSSPTEITSAMNGLTCENIAGGDALDFGPLTISDDSFNHAGPYTYGVPIDQHEYEWSVSANLTQAFEQSPPPVTRGCPPMGECSCGCCCGQLARELREQIARKENEDKQVRQWVLEIKDMLLKGMSSARRMEEIFANLARRKP